MKNSTRRWQIPLRPQKPGRKQERWRILEIRKLGMRDRSQTPVITSERRPGMEKRSKDPERRPVMRERSKEPEKRSVMRERREGGKGRDPDSWK